MLQDFVDDLEKEEYQELFREIESLAESFHIVNSLVLEQGEKIDLMERNVEQAEENLEIAEENLERAAGYKFISRKRIRNVAIVAGTLTAGALGFIAGPLIGIGTTLSGLAAGLGIITVAEKNK